MEYKELCSLFGAGPAVISRVIRRGELALSSALNRIKDARVSWPDKNTQREWGMLVNKKYPLIEGRFGFIDGKNYPVQAPTNSEKQNAMYNGWLHCVLITGTLCFGVDGTIIWGRHNFVGSWNDGDTSRPCQMKLINDDLTLQDHGIISDSAFPVSGALLGKIITPLKDGDLLRANPLVREMLNERSAAITSCRQACEWGMGAVEKVFRRLLMKLPYDQVVRKTRLRNIHKLYNYRVRRTGISQIRNVFMHHDKHTQ